MSTCPTCQRTYPGSVAACPEDGTALVPESTGEPSRPLLDPGTRVGDYRLERLLGQGTFGDVYAAAHVESGEQVAIKLLLAAFSTDPQLVARFTAEARAVGRARHPGIVDIHAVGVIEGGRHYLVMELLHGESLGERLHREPRLDPALAATILEGVAAALDAAHAAGVVHRDLKPDNVFLVAGPTGSSSPRLVDFGVAKLVDDSMGMKTATGAVIGTPRYMSPEQCRGKRVDHRADIYALGVLAHVMLTGQPPFRGETSVDLLLLHTTERPPAMSSVCPDLPEELDAPVLAMLAKKPADRPESAGAAVAALVEKIRRRPAPASPLGTVLMAPAPAPRRDEVATSKTLVAAAEPKAEDSTMVLASGGPASATLPAPVAARPLAATVLTEPEAAPAQVAPVAAPVIVPSHSPLRARSTAGYWIAAALALGLVGAGAAILLGGSASPPAAPSAASAKIAAPEISALPIEPTPAGSLSAVASAPAPTESAARDEPATSASARPSPPLKGHLPSKDAASARPTATAPSGKPDIGF